MNRYWYLLIVWAIAFCLAAKAGEYDGSVYKPLCEPRREKPTKKNVIYLLAGPAPRDQGGAQNLMGLGYFRQVKDDLELGVMGVGTERKFIGGMVGFGWRF